MRKVVEGMKPNMKHFEVIGVPGRIISPRLGLVNLNFALEEEKALECYRDINFPYLGLKEGAETLFKKDKIAELSRLIDKVVRTEDVEVLMKASKSAKVKEAAEAKLKTFS